MNNDTGMVKKMILSRRTVWWVISVLIATIIACGLLLYVVIRRPELIGLSRPDKSIKVEERMMVESISKFMLLPDEQPTIATITDREKLRGQAFFDASQNGDKVLIYTQAKKAILFRPSTNMIIDVAPVNLGTEATPSATTAPKPVTFVLYNGTNTTGLTKTYETTLTRLIANAVVTDRDNASRLDYETSILVDLTGVKTSTATEIAKTLGITVGSLPEGETKPSGVDFLIILGTDRQ